MLVLGGTSWLGGIVAETALREGHDVTCLARGTSGEVPAGARLVVADRDDPDAYAALPGRAAYDLVVDVARQPGHVRGAVRALAERATGWVLVSSCSVYARHDEPGADERAALLPALAADVAAPEEYGEGKVACEEAVTSARGGAALVARSGLIVGRGDPSERFGYWPGRFALAAKDGGPVLVPARVDAPVQWVDVVDLAAWIVRAGLAGTTGTVNATGRPTTLGAVLDAAAEAAGFDGERVYLDDEALAEAGVEEFMGARSLPLWIGDPAWRAFLDRSAEAALAAGLAPRALGSTMADALAWERQLGLSRARTRAGLDRDDELAIIARRA
ncbi:oxidoreductase [Intrasporangium oryzae NRRL B-24470]|uniref:Oxidoreductase n=1 Tax=Intrasporangium oryzae NRRL B-24470 TaxID=1386089 RepID=W9G3Z0_9MICO|nr:oxidoreductase [Intrasporangium oryzae NRRL B-24470]